MNQPIEDFEEWKKKLSEFSNSPLPENTPLLSGHAVSRESIYSDGEDPFFQAYLDTFPEYEEVYKKLAEN